MTINRLNYEKYAIDYLDGKLSPDLREEMVAFLHAHPDIKEEVEWQETFIAPQLPEMHLPNKGQLLKPVAVERKLYPIHWLAIAASFVLLIAFGLILWPKNENPQLVSGEVETPATSSEVKTAVPVITQDGVEKANTTTPIASTGVQESGKVKNPTTPKRMTPSIPNQLAQIQISDLVEAKGNMPSVEITLPENAEHSVSEQMASADHEENLESLEIQTREIPFFTLPAPIVPLRSIENTGLNAESAVALSAPVKPADERNRLGILKRILKPEAYSEEDEAFSLKESVIPEAYAALFTKD